jgi:CHASE2 domain-containing sensor protein
MGEHHSGESWKRFPRHLLAATPTLILLSAIILAAEILGWLEPIQRAGLDFFLRAEQPVRTNDLFIVGITDDDYNTYFDGKSPLNPCVVMQLVRKVADAHPAVIGVDLDTSSTDYAMLSCPPENRPPEAPEIAGTKIVWALVPEELEKAPGTLHFKDARVTGRQFSDTLEVGIPVFPVDGDGLVRKFAGEFRTDLLTGHSVRQSNVESLPRAVAKAYAESKELTFHEHEEGILRFTGQASPFHIIQADDFLHDAADPAFGKPDFGALSGKIVLIGGMYRAARDRYPTPVGTIAGVELIAHAVRSDLMGGGIREASHALAFVLDLIAGTIVVAIYFRWERDHFRRAFWVSMALVPLLSFAFSVLAFNTKAYWFDFAPVVLGMVMHQLYESSKKRQHMEDELREAHKRLQEMEAHSTSKVEAANPS